ncbi:GxxExxY protein [Asticcacaulis sp. EMRT-3]|uniref:GxxExxY protein n=1 Tax=Asticcacaulis sp. EMRT-3 TaxID=3040349 RepID=UPI0024AF4262|nr:GxxExxY protein [Asticcacaulis sp. EMRT-3]MDI7776003.1 GxxExxY protein [Asticcacaulis sp. EMRT-3]
MDKGHLLYEAETFAIRGAVFEVSREMGIGFLESVYQNCLQREFVLRNIPAISQPSLTLMYKGEFLPPCFQPDFVCYDKIIVELKAVRAIDDAHRAQTVNYLRATGYKLALLVNFGAHPKAQVERIAL